MSTLETFIELALEKNLFPHKRNRVVVACSGGVDSLFLLYLLWGCREKLDLELCVLTCDHGLRPESREEVREVRQRAWSLGLPCTVRELEVPHHREGRESTEMTARRLRRQAYVEVAKEFEARQVAVGHHLDDQAETVLLKLCRGTGPRGAGGMGWISPLVGNVNLVRPLLGYRRREISEQMQLWGITSVEDPSNQHDDFLRNRMRNEILPLLAGRINPEVVPNIGKFADQQRKLEAWVSSEANISGQKCIQNGDLHLEAWRFLPEILQERVLLGWLEEHDADLNLITYRHMRDLLAQLESPVSHARRWKLGGVSFRVDQDVCSEEKNIRLSDPVPLSLPGEINWEPLHRKLRASSSGKVDMSASSQKDFMKPLTAYARPPDGNQTLTVRNPQTGDRYSPLGLKGSIKLSDLFVNRRLPQKLRAHWPVVVCGDEIVWVPGFRVAERWKVKEPPCFKLMLLP
ncbi:MAG: tRNA lysidine(34) synthetase TilS [Kiritimatiellia bacterium]